MNKIIGNFYKTCGLICDFFLNGLIYLVNILISIFSYFRKIVTFLLSGGCLIILIFWKWIFYAILSNAFLLILVCLMIIGPFLGEICISYLKYIHYMVTEFFYDKSDYYLLGRKSAYENMKDYGKKYQEKEKEKRKKEQEQEQKYNSRFQGWTFTDFSDFSDFEDFFYQNQGYNQEQGYSQNQGYNQNGYTFNSFKKEYESSCEILNVPYNSDKYEIKLAFRKMAKKYHPDINKNQGATEMFQKINNAYEFLNDINIEKYKNLN